MNWHRLHTLTRAGMLAGLLIAAALSPRLAAPVSAATTASFIPASGQLSVFGDALDNTLTLSRDAAGTILVNGGAISVSGGTPTVANTALIQVFGLGGNDVIALSEANGALPAANLFGGGGDDTLTGGSGGDLLFGQAGNDTLLGKGGIDFLFGGADNDTLTGGDADDQVFGESGDDRMVWNPGDDTDLNEGGDGVDTVEVNGGNGAETFIATANGARVRFDRTVPAPFTLDIGTAEDLVVNANGGDDTVTAGNGLAPLIQLTVDGGAGNDTLTGGDGADVLLGGDGNDTVDGGRGNDVALLGAGDDAFVWDPGDGSDTVEGQAGQDTLRFNGSNVGEKLDLSANGGRLRLTRDVANIVMDLDDVEGVDVKALGGADTITVNDLSGTDVTAVALSLESVPGSGAGDGQLDTVIVNGTNGSDAVQVLGSGSSYTVVGLPAAVQVVGTEGANDALVVNALGGDDFVTAFTLPAGVVKLTVDAGAGSDGLFGSAGADVLIGGDGNDTVDGRQGNDVALLGAGDDTFAWDPGDGSDTVEGQAGADTLRFNGANVGEKLDLAANGQRLRLTRDVANITMDVDGVERVDVTARGGADTITVNDLTGTAVTNVALDLAGVPGGGGGDGQADTVIANGTAGPDRIAVGGSAAGVTVSGLAATVNIVGGEAANDGLTVNALAEADTVDASGLPAGLIKLTLYGGDGNDLLIGSQGDDTAAGGRGNDVAFLGTGDDAFVWEPGDGSDTVEGQAGQDTLAFNGANIGEKLDLSANGGRLRLTRDVAAIVMDLNDVERVDVSARGGADTITINSLAGTDVTAVALNLESQPGSGAGDGQLDTVIVNGTNGNDAIAVGGSAAGVSVSGLAATVTVVGSEAANDSLVVNSLDGNDSVTAQALPAGLVKLTLDGGDGNDTLTGSAGNDQLFGGAGKDVLDGGPGTDVLDGGPGKDLATNGETLINIP